LLRGEAGEVEIAKAAAITARYGKAKDLEKVEVIYEKVNEESHRSISVSSIPDEEIANLMIN
jgi:hypothetical protein